MRKQILQIGAACLLLTMGTRSEAQCTFTPTVTPNNLVLCPAMWDTLWTQVYDSYQWYKAGQPIPGANQQYLVVDHFFDGGNYFKVEVTDDGCTEMSDSVLVDGWAFLPPFVAHEGTYQLHPTLGHPVVCPGDTFYLILMQPYSASIQWYKDGQMIPGANDDTLLITQSGNYTVEGAPEACPDWLQPLGVHIEIEVKEQPVLTQVDNYLVVTPGAPPLTGINWYLNGLLIQGQTNDTLVPTVSGMYHVTAQEGACSYESQPLQVIIMGVDDRVFAEELQLYPNPTSDVVIVKAVEPFKVSILDALGRVVLTDAAAVRERQLKLSHLPRGVYTIRLQHNDGVLTRQLLLQ